MFLTSCWWGGEGGGPGFQGCAVTMDRLQGCCAGRGGFGPYGWLDAGGRGRGGGVVPGGGRRNIVVHTSKAFYSTKRCLSCTSGAHSTSRLAWPPSSSNMSPALSSPRPRSKLTIQSPTLLVPFPPSSRARIAARPSPAPTVPPETPTASANSPSSRHRARDGRRTDLARGGALRSGLRRSTPAPGRARQKTRAKRRGHASRAPRPVRFRGCGRILGGPVGACSMLADEWGRRMRMHQAGLRRMELQTDRVTEVRASARVPFQKTNIKRIRHIAARF